MYEIVVKTKFDAAHQLREYKGKCANIHGHTWNVELYLKGNMLNKEGMLIDFSEVKELLEEEINKYDHRLINEVEPFTIINPTAENIACEIYKNLKRRIPQNISITKVAVWESPNACAIYREE